jgi:hypothetical protein
MGLGARAGGGDMPLTQEQRDLADRFCSAQATTIRAARLAPMPSAQPLRLWLNEIDHHLAETRLRACIADSVSGRRRLVPNPLSHSDNSLPRISMRVRSSPTPIVIAKRQLGYSNLRWAASA